MLSCRQLERLSRVDFRALGLLAFGDLFFERVIGWGRAIDRTPRGARAVVDAEILAGMDKPPTLVRCVSPGFACKLLGSRLDIALGCKMASSRPTSTWRSKGCRR